MNSGMRLWLIAAALALTACSSSQQKAAQNAASAAPQQISDAVIIASVKAKLATIDVDSATNVHVDSSHGHVTLSGEARTDRQRVVFEDATRSVNGVTGVTDQMKANAKLRGARESLSDAALATKVMGTVAAQTGVNAFGVKAVAHDGAVTLYGNVPTVAIKATMLETARKTGGVTSVVDKLSIKP